MRIWVDLTNSPHVLVLRPVVERLRAAGHDVRVTARDFAQTVELAEQHGMDAEVIGRHRGEKVGAKAIGLVSRSVALTRWARGKRFDIAFGHGSNDVSVAARLLRVPCSTMFDYEWASVQHNVNCRLAQAVVVPDVIPVAQLERYGARGKIRGYPGLKEEYYLADFEPDAGVLDELGLDSARAIAVVPDRGVGVAPVVEQLGRVRKRTRRQRHLVLVSLEQFDERPQNDDMRRVGQVDPDTRHQLDCL